MKITSITLLLALNHVFVSMGTSNDYKLELLQVLFRHGDRTPSESEEYQTDPYTDLFKKLGYGQLTAQGMKRVYDTGRFIRNRYDDFLGNYTSDGVYAFSSDYDRTKMSLQLMLSALYPPSKHVVWSDDIHWTPIPVHSEHLESNILNGFEVCPKYEKLFNKALDSPEVHKKLERYKDFFKYAKNQTGIPEANLSSIRNLYSNVHAVVTMGLPLPDWCTQEDYQKLVEIAGIAVEPGVHTDFMKRMTIGPMLEQFIKNIQDSEKQLSKRKIYLYSGHDLNIAYFEKGFNLTNVPEVPDFGTALIIEKLKGPDNRAYIRMLLYAGVINKLIPLKLENCTNKCPLTTFLKIAKPLLPNAEVRKCFPAVTCRKKN